MKHDCVKCGQKDVSKMVQTATRVASMDNRQPVCDPCLAQAGVKGEPLVADRLGPVSLLGALG